MNSIPQETNPVKEERRLLPYDRAFYIELNRKFRYFSDKKKLNKNGSFYQRGKDIIERIGGSKWTINRSRKRLQDLGLIRYQAGKWTGVATLYWIMDQTKKEEPPDPKKQDERPPLDLETLKSITKLTSAKWAIRHFEGLGYQTAEIIKALEAPKETL